MIDKTAPTAELEAPAADTATPEPKAEPKAEAPKDEKPDKTPEQALDDDLRKTFRKHAKGRDESGKYVTKKDEPPTKQLELEEAIKDKPAKAEEPKAETPKTEPAKPKVNAPNSWKAEFKEKFGTLPEDVQGYVAQRETEATQAITKLGQAMKAFEPIGQVLTQHADYIQGVGKHPAQFIGELMAASRALDTDPAGTIKRLAEAYRVDLTQLVDPFAPAPDPQVSMMQDRVAQLERQLAERDNREQAWQRQQQEARSNQSLGLVEEFIKDKEDINLIGREFEAQIRALRASNPTEDPRKILQDAYDRAIWANPDTRARLIQRQQAEADQARIEEAKKRANDARSASSINVSGAARASQPADMDADLRAIWRKRAS